MPFSQTNYGPLKVTNVSLATGAISESTSSYYAATLTGNLRNTVRRTKPSDLFANATGYSVYEWTREDRRYVRPPSAAPGFRVTQPAQFDFSHGFLDVSGKINEIHSKLRAKIKDQNVNLAQNVAEYRQASSMFAGLASDIVRTFRSLRSGRAFADFVRILQSPRSSKELAIANRWLQYQYGVKPLMSDLYGVSDALAKGIRDGMYLHVRSKLEDAYVREFKSSDQNIIMWRWDATTRGIARYKISDPTMKTVTQFGISNPLLLAWELIPYSFVIDWMFPVGNFLSSLDALNGTSDLRVITSLSEVHYQTFTPVYGGGGVSSWKGWRYTRSAPVTNLQLPKLGYKPSKSLTAVLNGLALLTQLRRR